jgi:hypothetical protein
MCCQPAQVSVPCGHNLDSQPTIKYYVIQEVNNSMS